MPIPTRRRTSHLIDSRNQHQDQAQRVVLFQGDNVTRLGEIEIEADLCITSPPYFQQFDYELKGQHGHEETVDLFVDTQVRLFREVRRLLVDGGTCFILIGDTSNNISPVRARHQRKSVNKDWLFRRKLQGDYREKELLSVPFRLAEALRQDGWVHRNTLIWEKSRSSAMGNSDTAPLCHEYILHLINWPRHGRPYGNTGPLRSSILRHAPASHPKHGCVFPVSLVQELLSVFENDLAIIDPYIGSGTVAIAALPFGHRVYGFDLDCSIAMAECTKAGTVPALSIAPTSLRERAA